VIVDLAVVGAIALDEIHSQAGDIDQVLGGSAVYASLAASILARTGSEIPLCRYSRGIPILRPSIG